MTTMAQPASEPSPARAQPLDAFKRILVHVDVDRPSQSRMSVASTLAERFGGRMTGVYVPKLVMPALLGTPEFPAAVLLDLEARTLEDAENAGHLFRDHVAKKGLEADWLVARGDPVSALTNASRYMDITVLGQIASDAPNIDGTVRPDEIVLGSGRPVLITPYIGAPSEVGSRIVVAWDGGREAARAVADAMPLLRQAGAVWVISIDGTADTLGDDSAAEDLCSFLADHGVAARPETLGADEAEPSDVVLSRIVDLGADLLVMGCYGHTRLRETVLGGMTRDILRHMTVPVLMSH